MNNGHEDSTKEEVAQMAVCGLYICTSGLLGPNLGSDEQDICLLGYSLIDLNSNQVLGVQEYVVQPSNCDLNSNFLSDEVKEETRLTEAAIRTSGVTLEKAINLFASYCRSLNVDLSTLLFITDGQLPLRQCLHPEASDKVLELPDEYNRFADLRKDIARFYRAGDSKFNSITDLLTFLDIPNSGDTSFFSKELKDMVNIIQRLILDGYKFNVIETINISLEPGICSKDEDVDNNCVVRARGLPWQSSDQDIARFFRGLNIAKGGVALCLSLMGRRNGEALVRFDSSEHRDMALKRHKHHIGQRYIEVYRASGDDFVSVAGGSNNEAQAFLTRGAQVIIRMRGLPYDCTAQQVIEFFENGENPCSVMDGEQGLLFVKRPDGRSTGDAFVLFKEESDAPKAISRHRDTIGTRYIELFRSTTAEVQQVLNRTMETYESQQLSLPPPPVVPSHLQPPPALPLPPVPLLPQHIITSGTKKDCIRLRGLPYEALIEHILEFLGEHAKNIAYQGVHMVYNSQGQPSGEAFIQMDCEASAHKAAQFRHHKYMSFGKKLRYIEVFQCSGEDMNQVLSGGLAQPGSLSSPTGPDVPPSVVPQPQAPTQQSVQQPNLLAAAVQAAAAKQLLSPGGYLMRSPPGYVYVAYPSPPTSPTHHLLIMCPEPTYAPTHLDQRWGTDGLIQMVAPMPPRQQQRPPQQSLQSVHQTMHPPLHNRLVTAAAPQHQPPHTSPGPHPPMIHSSNPA